jgi:hypothetical protein
MHCVEMPCYAQSQIQKRGHAGWALITATSPKLASGERENHGSTDTIGAYNLTEVYISLPPSGSMTTMSLGRLLVFR